MPPSERPRLSAEAMNALRAEADRLGLSTTDLLDAAAEQVAATVDPVGAATAAREIAAYQAGTAVPMGALTLPTVDLTLCIRGGAWVDEPIITPIVRGGYGVRRGASLAELAKTAQGFYRVRAIRQSTRVVLFRRGIPVAHCWGEDWAQITVNGVIRRYARRILVSDGQQWIDADTNRASTPLDAEDRAVETVLASLVIVCPAGNRNPIFWAAQRLAR